jgi:hypothetical protein
LFYSLYRANNVWLSPRNIFAKLGKKERAAARVFKPFKPIFKKNWLGALQMLVSMSFDN